MKTGPTNYGKCQLRAVRFELRILQQKYHLRINTPYATGPRKDQIYLNLRTFKSCVRSTMHIVGKLLKSLSKLLATIRSTTMSTLKFWAQNEGRFLYLFLLIERPSPYQKTEIVQEKKITNWPSSESLIEKRLELNKGLMGRNQFQSKSS